jgi:hypothetical protein
MISPELAHRAGKGENLVYDLASKGWSFKDVTFFDRHKNEDVLMVGFKSPKMKTFSFLVEREWYNITKKHLLRREKDSL